MYPEAVCACRVFGRWAEGAWKAWKLAHETHERYFSFCRDGCLPRKRKFDAVRAEELRIEKEAELAASMNRFNNNASIFKLRPGRAEADA